MRVLSFDPNDDPYSWAAPVVRPLRTRNTKCCPSGRKQGQRWESSFFFGSSVVTCSTVPPDAETRESPPAAPGEKRITPSWFHVPPRGVVASASTCSPPPDASSLFIFPSAKNPMVWLSGDQKGNCAPSVPARGWADSDSSGRTHSWVFPAASTAAKANLLPSGEIAISKGLNDPPSGARMLTRVGRTRGELLNIQGTAMPMAASAQTVATAQARLCDNLRRLLTGAGMPACEPPSAIHCSCSLTSCAVCQRSSGSFDKQPWTTRSSAGGDIGCTADIGCGSDARIAATMLAWLLPLNARLPVAI